MTLDSPSYLKEKLGVDSFKPVGAFHIAIKEGKSSDSSLGQAAIVCPAGLYSQTSEGEYEICEDGCLECGSCLAVCGPDVLSWEYPQAQCGVQYRMS